MGRKKQLRFEENATMPHVIQANFQEVFRKNHPLKGKWKKDFFHNDHPLVLELGCGRGEYTVGLARLFPHQNFIGIDIKGARIWYGAKKSQEENLKNVAFLRTRIDFIDSFFDTHEVNEIWLPFPDPQKEKERKRLTSDRFLSLFQHILVPGGLIHLKTDSDLLYEYTLQQIRKHQLTMVENIQDLYHTTNDPYIQQNPWLTHLQTYYEQKFLNEQKKIKYLCFSFSP